MGSWARLVTLQARARDYLVVLGLDLIIDEAEGYAFVRSRTTEVDEEAADDGQATVPRLVARRQLSFAVSLLLALLRRKLAEFDARGGESRLVLCRADIVDLLRVFLPDRADEAKLFSQIDTHIQKVVDLGFLKRLGRSSRWRHTFEVRRIIKAFVDAQWLSDFDARLSEYQQSLGRDLTAVATAMTTDDAPRSTSPPTTPLPASGCTGSKSVELGHVRPARLDTRTWMAHNTLLTGDIGSGKSTVVDAVTTLLVPAHRVAYNKAAGAEHKERSLRSYVLGYYKSERNGVGGCLEAGCAPRPFDIQRHPRCVPQRRLRPDGHPRPGVLDEGGGGQPARLFVGAEHDLTIAEHFTSFGADIPALRKRLKAQGADINDTFSAVRSVVPATTGDPVQPSARSVPPDRVDEVGRQPHRVRSSPHAGCGQRQ